MYIFTHATLGNTTEASFRTKVVSNNLHPVWDEVFEIHLPLPTDRSKLRMEDFPTVRIEVYDMNLLGLGSFLGSTVLLPRNYFGLVEEGIFSLGPSISFDKKENKLITDALNGGFNPSVELKWRVMDREGGYREKNVLNIYGNLRPILYIGVEILNCRNLKIANKSIVSKGSSNPYCKLYICEECIGETSCKKGTIDPNWSNEYFSYDISDIVGGKNYLRIEVWSKSLITNEIFLGEVVVGEVDLLHYTQEPYELPLQPRHGEQQKIDGTISFTVSSKRLRQKYRIPALEIKERQTDDVNSIGASKSVQLSIIPDPKEERRRQIEEFHELKLPSIIEKSETDLLKYTKHPFERKKSISEVHYGQVLYSYHRMAKTILRSESSETIVIPISFVNSAYKVMDEEVNEHVDGTPKGDLINLVCSYPVGGIPRKDQEMLQKLALLMDKNMKKIDEREKRKELRRQLLPRVSTMATGNDEPPSIVVQAIMNIERSLPGIFCEMFLEEQRF